MPVQPPHQSLDLSEAETRALEQYAQQRGITPDEAATELARETIQRRYVRRRAPASVLPFKPRA